MEIIIQEKKIDQPDLTQRKDRKELNSSPPHMCNCDAWWSEESLLIYSQRSVGSKGVESIWVST